MYDLFSDEELFIYVIAPKIRFYNRARFALNMLESSRILFLEYLRCVYKIDGEKELYVITKLIPELIKTPNFASRERLYIYTESSYINKIVRGIID